MPMRSSGGRSQGGVTLIELVISIVIISVGVAGILSVMNLTAAKSADPVLRMQSLAIAQSYLEEILLRDFADPDVDAEGTNRAIFDDVDDYHALANNGCLSTSAACPVPGDCACDQFGAPIDDLPNYTIGVSVVADTLNGAPVQRVAVTVSHQRVPDVGLTLTGYRANF